MYKWQVLRTQISPHLRVFNDKFHKIFTNLSRVLSIEINEILPRGFCDVFMKIKKECEKFSENFFFTNYKNIIIRPPPCWENPCDASEQCLDPTLNGTVWNATMWEEWLWDNYRYY